MTVETSGDVLPESREMALLRGRVAMIHALSHHYLFLPFAVLCMASALVQRNGTLIYVAMPFLLQIAASVGGNRLRRAYEKSDPNDDPAIWARRYTWLSGIAGAIWGLGAVIWFDFTSFAAEAYLVLAFLGLSATEFIARSAYRPAYVAHAVTSLGPLAVMLILQGGLYQTLSALLVIFFGGVLSSFGTTLGPLLDDCILLRYDNRALIARLDEEKHIAEATRDAAKASERAKSAFIANISHELRTPLNAILGMAQLLETSDLEKAQRDHVKVLLEAGRGLKTLLDDIIVLATQAEEPLKTPDGGCDAAQAARTVARLMQPNAWEKRLRLSINVASGLPRVAADPRLLRRVLLKLAGNAIRFTDRGNIEIALDATTDAAGQEMVRFVITDTGPGIPHHLLKTIFEPFGRSEDSYAARHSGTGVGLAVVKSLVESIGGTIGVESEPGMGASFWIMIPVTHAAPVAESAESEHVAPPAGLSLLALISDLGVRALLEQFLTPFGNRITYADTLAQATTMSARGGFAVILASAENADGLAAAPGQRTPILALSTNDDRPPDGANGVLRWPAPREALYAAIHAVTHEQDAQTTDEAKEAVIDAAIDAKAIADLEKSLGFKTLIDILQSYLHTAEELATALSVATENEDWAQAERVAQDIAGAAGGLGLTSITSAARTLCLSARDGIEQSELSAAASTVLSEHERVREALRRLYPDLSA